MIASIIVIITIITIIIIDIINIIIIIIIIIALAEVTALVPFRAALCRPEGYAEVRLKSGGT